MGATEDAARGRPAQPSDTDFISSDPPAKEAPPDKFGNSAREYELGRPVWPGELVDRAATDLGLGPDSTVLDLGAGTGKLTRDLVTRFGRVIAVEPDGAMRAVLEEVVPDAEALEGRAEAVPLQELAQTRPIRDWTCDEPFAIPATGDRNLGHQASTAAAIDMRSARRSSARAIETANGGPRIPSSVA